jgi:hypothetical protein
MALGPDKGERYPIRHTFCCAGAASGHATAALTKALRNSRRLILVLNSKKQHPIISARNIDVV